MSGQTREETERDAMAQVVEDAWCAAWASLRHAPGTVVNDTPAFLRVITPASTDMLMNAVLRFRTLTPVTRDEIAWTIAPYHAARRPMQWWLRLGAGPPGLREILFDVGMQPWGTPLCMALPMAAWRPEALPVAVQARSVTTQAEAEAALQVICAVFGLTSEPMRHWCIENPEMQPFLALVRGRPAGALVMQCRKGVAGFFHVATLPEFRRHGVASALMQCALASARAQGMDQAALTASPMAETLYHHLGFQPCGRIETWMPAPRLMRDLTGAQ